MKNRTFTSLIISVALIGIYGFLQGPEKDRLFSEDGFYANKILQKSDYDIVICGDSRALIGVSPQILSERFHNAEVFNFSFPAIPLTAEYLEACAVLIDPESEYKTIFIAVAPETLMRSGKGKNNFKKYYQEGKLKLKRTMRLASVSDYFKPFPLFSRKGKMKRERILKKNGWMAVETKAIHHQNLLNNAVIWHGRNKISQDLFQGLIRSVSDFSNRGFTVYGFWPPCTPNMDKIESELGGFSSRKISKAFREAGGVWLPVSRDQYESYDASHLNRENAIKFTKDLGELISIMLREN